MGLITVLKNWSQEQITNFEKNIMNIEFYLIIKAGMQYANLAPFSPILSL